MTPALTEGARGLAAGARLALGLLLVLTIAPSPVMAQGPAALWGRVSQPEGLPVLGAVVVLEGTGLQAATDAEGRYRLTGLSPGRFRLSASAPGFAAVSVEISLPREGEPVRRDLTLALEPVRLGEVVTEVLRERGGGPAEEVGSRWVIRREDLARAGSVDRALARLPGVFVKEYGSGGAREVSIRGGNPDQTLVLWDEERLASAAGGAVDLKSLPVGAVDSIEVLTRGASSRFGSGALAGVVRIHPARAGGPSALRLEARAGAGSLGERSASAEAGLGLDGFALAAGGSVRSLERNHGRRDNAGGEESRGSLSLRLPALGLAASGFIQRSRLGAPGPVPNPTPRATIESDRALASLALSRSHGAWSLRGEGSMQVADVAYADPDRPGAGQTSRESGLALRAGAARAIGASRVEAGLEARRGRSRLSGVEGRPLRRDLGVYAGGRWALGGAWDVAALPSARLDWIAVESGSPTATAAPAGAPPSALSRSDLFLSPALSMAARPLEALALRAAAGRSFGYPGLVNLFFISGVGVRGNPDLREERSRDLELAAEWTPRPGLTVRAAAFDRRIDGAIVWLPDFQFVWSPRNLPRAVVRGGEISGRWRPAPELELNGAWTYAPARFDFPGNRNPLPYRPAHVGRLELVGGVGPLRSALEARFTGRRFPNVAGTNALEAFWLADWSLAWRRTLGNAGALEVEGRIENLLDRSYEVVFGFPGGGRALAVAVAYGPP